MYKQEFPKSWTLVIGHIIDLKFNVHQQQYQSKSLLHKKKIYIFLSHYESGYMSWAIP